MLKASSGLRPFHRIVMVITLARVVLVSTATIVVVSVLIDKSGGLCRLGRPLRKGPAPADGRSAHSLLAKADLPQASKGRSLCDVD